MIPSVTTGLLLLFVTTGTTSFTPNTSVANDIFPEKSTFNPMELYVNTKEGVSLAFDAGNGQKFAFWFYFFYIYFQVGNSFKSNAKESYTRILVGPSKGNNIYPLQYAYVDLVDASILRSEVHDMVVHQNNDGTVALSCVASGLYATWGNYECNSGWCSSGDNLPICTESGICPHCRYRLVVGAINDIRIRVVDLEWGDPDEAFQSSPSQVAKDSTENHSDTEITTTLRVEHTSSTSDTTVWEQAWGFEYSVEWSGSVGIPGVIGGTTTATATASYNGKYGTENTVTSSETFEQTKTVVCPARTRCVLKYVASKLDNYDMPFTATVERSQDEGAPIQWEEEGVWRGVQAFDFKTIYCTESLETGVSNCPNFPWIK